jgi:hypothetical protein
MVRSRTLLVTAALVASGCATSFVNDDGLEGLALSSVRPAMVVPGSVLAIEGRSFVDRPWGVSRLRFEGTFTDAAGQRSIDVVAPARFVDFDHLEVDVGGELFTLFGSDEGDFAGAVTVEVENSADGRVYVTESLPMELAVRPWLDPRLDRVQTEGLVFVNDDLEVEGAGLLFGGGEGTTYAVLSGCFSLEGGGGCTPIDPIEIPVTPRSRFDRSRGAFAFSPRVAGIRPGTFTGSVRLRNAHASGELRESGADQVTYDLIEPIVFSVGPTAASLGQYVEVSCGGFVGGADGGVTLLSLVGTYTPTGAPSGVPVDLVLVPEFFAGRTVRYVVSEDDSLGEALDLRRDTGTFVGNLTPIIAYGADEVTGQAAPVTLSIAPVKQVIYLHFLPSYVESLRHFGLRGADALIRERVAEVVRRDYAGVNLEVRDEPPTDFALYSHVDIAGPDPNGLGLFGYDNTPGKDTGNQRLYDRIGGVNAQTQEDGFPGFGGVFIESLFAFSPNPGSFAQSVSGADPTFDAVFDPTRPDRGGERVRAVDLAGGIPKLDNGDACPATDRGEQIACAVFVLGSLIGTTTSHEIGHSLGLANPYGDGFHNPTDGINRLMDGGADRPFLERAELFGHGPAVFCDEEYDYLRVILPSDEPPPAVNRPGCL